MSKSICALPNPLHVYNVRMLYIINCIYVFQSGTEACEKCNMKEVCNLVNGSCKIKGLFICYFISEMTAISDMKSVSNEKRKNI